MKLTRFYPPTFLIEAGGDLMRDLRPFIQSFEFKDEHKKPDEIRLTIINDAFKWTDDPRLQNGVVYSIRWGYPTLWSDLLKVKVQKGVPTFPRNQVPTITLISWDSRLDLTKADTSVNWGQVSSSEVARRLAKKWGLKTDISESNDARKQDRVQTVRQTDLAYLAKLADDLNFQFDIVGDTLIFKPYDYAATATLTYTYFTDREGVILDFKPEIKEKQLRKKIGAISTDSKGGTASAVSAFFGNVADKVAKKTVQGETGSGKYVELATSGGVITGTSPEPAKVAAMHAQAASDKVSLDAEKGTLTIVGDPRLRKGKVIELRGFGVRYSGRWYVSSTKHTMSCNAMYITEAKVQRAPLNTPAKGGTADSSKGNESGKVPQKVSVEGAVSDGKFVSRVTTGAKLWFNLIHTGTTGSSRLLFATPTTRRSGAASVATAQTSWAWTTEKPTGWAGLRLVCLGTGVWQGST